MRTHVAGVVLCLLVFGEKTVRIGREETQRSGHGVGRGVLG
jgi:hypothetical protein